MMIPNYLKYLQSSLGLSGVLLTPEIIESALKSEAPSGETPQEREPQTNTAALHSPVFEAEQTYVSGAPYRVLFLRLSDSRLSLKEDREAEELFSKLRGALGLQAEVAPWVESSLGDWQVVLQQLRSQSERVILMLDETLEKGKTDRPEWIIPDPAVLVQQVHLKRPTWELLKEWKS